MAAVPDLVRCPDADAFDIRSSSRIKLSEPGKMPVPAVVDTARGDANMLERVLIRSGTHVDVIAVDKIDYVLAQDDYVAFTAGGKECLKQQTVANLERQLAPSRFVRIHRS